MRDPDRLDELYNEIMSHHKGFPDLRFWQFIQALSHCIEEDLKTDPFYLEDDKFLEYIRKKKRLLRWY